MTISISDKIDWTTPVSQSTGTHKSTTDWTMPAGEFGCEIMKAEMHAAKDNKFTYLDVQFMVLVPEEYKKKLFFLKFYFTHQDYPNLPLVGKRQLKDIGYACFGKQISHGSDLIGGKLYITLSRKEGNPNPKGGFYPASNRMESVKAINGSVNANSTMPSMSTKIPDPVPVTEFNDEIPF